jgi:hypothetical protein
MASAKEVPKTKRKKRATSIKAREDQLIALAVDAAEEQLRNGTASNAVITHYLKLATTREQLEQKMLAEKVQLVSAQAESVRSAAKVESIYKEALDAMRLYNGQAQPEEEYYE